MDSVYWEKEIETLAKDEIRKLQLSRLRETVSRVQRVPFYQEKFRQLSFAPDMIRSRDSIKALPFTTKKDLRNQFPYGLLAVPAEECVRVHTSSGTSGRATAILHTRNDVENWSGLVARCLYGVGVRKSDVFQNSGGYGLFTGGLGFHYGAQKIGALTIPASAGNSKRQVQLMVEFGTTAIHIMPSFALYLTKVFEKMGLNPAKDTKLKYMFLGAEPHSEETRKRIESLYGAKAYNSYGLSEMNGPGTSFECPVREGLHIWEDNFIVEIIDAEGDEPVPVGTVGELVYTTLQREAMPLIRYRSGDLAYSIPDPCPCGRTHCRISRIQGRVDDMIIWKGVNIFPVQIDRVLMDFSEIDGTYLVLLEDKDDVDQMTVQVEMKEAFLKGDPAKAEDLKRKIIDALQSELLVKPEVQFVPAGTVPVSEVEKAKRVIDKRKL
jgi:phenylacetate-CoA ligase